MALAWDEETGDLLSVTDALSQVTSFERDAVGRVTTTTLPGDRDVTFSRDAGGRLTDIAPPGRDPHHFTLSEGGQVDRYDPPEVEGTPTPQAIGWEAYSYNDDGQWDGSERSDGAELLAVYESSPNSGRIAELSFTGQSLSYGTTAGSLTFTWSETTGHLTGIERSDGVDLEVDRVGPLPVEERWGDGTWYVGWTYDEDLRVETESVHGSSTATFGYDADGLLTSVGVGGSTLSLSRETTTGRLSGTTLGDMVTSYGYTGFGELGSWSASYDSEELLSQTLERDALGRVTTRTEVLTLSETPVESVWTYTYDDAGRLASAILDPDGGEGEEALETFLYDYDANGNRLPAGEEEVEYDAQDRLLTYDDTSYTWTSHGTLASRTDGSGTTTYVYDAFGQLREVDPPSGPTITYGVDAAGRRVSRAENGSVTTRYVYSGSRLIAEVGPTGAVTTRYVYGSQGHVPDLMVRSGTVYRLVTDALGSVRLVVNASTGAVAQHLSYDAWGVVLDSTCAPGFDCQPFGFAGGLYDPATGLVRFGRGTMMRGWVGGRRRTRSRIRLTAPAARSCPRPRRPLPPRPPRPMRRRWRR